MSKNLAEALFDYIAAELPGLESAEVNKLKSKAVSRLFEVTVDPVIADYKRQQKMLIPTMLRNIEKHYPELVADIGVRMLAPGDPGYCRIPSSKVITYKGNDIDMHFNEIEKLSINEWAPYWDKLKEKLDIIQQTNLEKTEIRSKD